MLVVLCALAVLLLAYPARTAATGTPIPTKHPVNAAWQRAQELGVYRFATTVVETTHPAPTVGNVGRGCLPAPPAGWLAAEQGALAAPQN